MMTLSRGEAILSHVFEKWAPDQGPIPRRQNGVLISDRAGDTVPYGMFGLLDRGEFFIAPGTPHKTLAFLGLGAWFVVQGGLFLLAVVGLATLARRLPASPQIGRWLNGLGAALFTALAARMVRP